MTGIILPYRGVSPRIAKSAFIAPTATIIGDVEIGEDSNIWFGCVIRGDVNEIRIGAGTNIQDGTVVHVSREKYGTYIGDNITIGHMALIHACTLERRLLHRHAGDGDGWLCRRQRRHGGGRRADHARQAGRAGAALGRNAGQTGA